MTNTSSLGSQDWLSFGVMNGFGDRMAGFSSSFLSSV